MSRHDDGALGPKGDEREARLKARQKIVLMANRYSALGPGRRLPYTMRHLQRAVSICKRAGLVSEMDLSVAGFNPAGLRTGPALPAGALLYYTPAQVRAFAEKRRAKGRR